MRNTIFIKAPTALAFLATPALAAPPEGCWTRVYDRAHLKSQPAQVVEMIMLRFFPEPDGKSATANLAVVAANQGHAGKRGLGGEIFEQFLFCYRDKSATAGWSCSVECDGGQMKITRMDSKVMEFRTNYLLTGHIEDCGGVMDLAEKPGQPVTYRLYRHTGKYCTWE